MMSSPPYRLWTWSSELHLWLIVNAAVRLGWALALRVISWSHLFCWPPGHRSFLTWFWNSFWNIRNSLWDADRFAWWFWNKDFISWPVILLLRYWKGQHIISVTAKHIDEHLKVFFPALYLSLDFLVTRSRLSTPIFKQYGDSLLTLNRPSIHVLDDEWIQTRVLCA